MDQPKYIVDTHALIWYLEGNPKLGSTAATVMDDPNSLLVLPMIALAEAIDIVSKGRTSIPGVGDLLEDIGDDPRLELDPLTLEVLEQSLSAKAVPEMHDRLIVAAGLNLEKQGFRVLILTRDPDIIASGLLQIVW